MEQVTIDKYGKWLLVYQELSNLAAYGRHTSDARPSFTEEQVEQETVNVVNTIMKLLDSDIPRPAWIRPTNDEEAAHTAQLSSDNTPQNAQDRAVLRDKLIPGTPFSTSR